MAITVQDLARSLRVDANDAELMADVQRLLTLTHELVSRHAPDAPATVADEARIRVAGYLFDIPLQTHPTPVSYTHLPSPRDS